MSIMRNPPEKLFIYALAAYGLGAALTLFNVACSYFYFKTVAPGGGWIGNTIAFGVALLMNIVESGVLMIFLSADEAGHLFTPPRIEIPGFPRFWSKVARFIILGMFGLVLVWTYRIDLQSTQAFLRASGSVGWFIVVSCVFGSELLMLLGHTLWALSKLGRANTAGMWAELNKRLKGIANSVPAAQRPMGVGGSTQAPPQGRPTSGSLSDEVAAARQQRRAG